MTVPGYPSFNENSRQPPLKPGEELVGKYRVEQVIGAGAMGVVVLAWHIELEQQVAIKFLYPEFACNANGAERFRREARAAVRIRNEHVARVLDVGVLEEQSIPFIVMEYLEGRDLARELKERGPLPALDAIRYVREACEAVAEAHSHGIVHRDLKPANLFLCERLNGVPMIKVLDFGISKLVSGNPQRLAITDTSILLGSPAYMSPEQLESSRSVDGRSDVWSLGVILYELVSGRLPFNGESVPQLIRSIVMGARAPLTSGELWLAQLEPVVARCLKQERAERFQTIAELCAALDAVAPPGAALPIDRDRTGVAHAEPAPVAHAEPAAAAEAARPGATGAEGAWGRTHGGRRASWPRRSLPFVALLALIVCGGVWGLRSERRAARERVARSAWPTPASSSAAAAPAPASEGAPLSSAPPPQVAPVPASESGVTPAPVAPARAVIGGGPPARASNTPTAPASTAALPPAPRAVAIERAAVPPAPAATASPTGEPVAPPAPAAAPPVGAPAEAMKNPGVGGKEPAPSASEPPAGERPPEVVPPRGGRFEIPEFGGRE